jgi:hypothetical protein
LNDCFHIFIWLSRAFCAGDFFREKLYRGLPVKC